MKKALLLLIFECFVISVSAQQQKLDSLLNELQVQTQPDTFRLNLLNNISFTYKSINPVKGLQYANEAMILAENLGNENKLATAYCYQGMNYSAMGQHQQALTCYNSAINILSKTNFDDQKAIVYTATGVVYNDTYDSYNAVEYYFKALDIFERNNDKNGMAADLCDISIIHNNLGNDSLALKYQLQAFTLYRETNNKQGMVNALGNAANSYLNAHKEEKALKLYQQALLLSEQIGYKQGISNSNTNIGEIYNRQHNFPEALHYFMNALTVARQMSDATQQSFLMNSIANVYAVMPEDLLKQKDIPAMKRDVIVYRYLSEGLKLAIKTHNIEVEADIWNQISQQAQKNGEYNTSLTALRKYAGIKDSIYNLNNKKQQLLVQLEMQRDFDKQKELTQAQLAKERVEKNAAIGGGGVMVLCGFAGFLFYKHNKNMQMQKREADLKLLISDTEMKALRSQMNPHFIFNSLNSINDYINKNETATATMYTTKFAKLIRIVLENSEKKEVPLSEDLNALELYMQLEALRLRNKFSFEIIIDDTIDTENTLVPPLILQPFVENSIWHGMSKKQTKGNILIHIRKEGEMINCIVEDDGVGIIKSEMIKEGKKSLGMKITKARIDLINTLKKANASIQVVNKTEGFKVEVRLPLELSF